VTIKGAPSDFTVRFGIGKWLEHLGVAAIETLLLSELFFVVDVADSLWNLEIEKQTHCGRQDLHRLGARPDGSMMESQSHQIPFDLPEFYVGNGSRPLSESQEFRAGDTALLVVESLRRRDASPPRRRRLGGAGPWSRRRSGC